MECTMKRSWLFLLAAMLCTTASIAGLNRSIAGSNDIDLSQWTPPDINTVADDPFGTLVKYGHALFTIPRIRSGQKCPIRQDASLVIISRAKTAICMAGP